MANVTSEPAPPSTVGRDTLRIVLFGMPAAGKSSLLGALSQAAQTQEHLLNGRLTDRSQGLIELQQRVYEDRGRPTSEEVVPYPVHFDPFTPADSQAAAARPLDAILMDCDGRVANDLLARRKSLDVATPEGTLAHEVLGADALILVIDASAAPAQVEADFKEFGRFLRLLEEYRGEHTEVGGLPVFLVLTKCDLLAQATDSPTDWMERIEERKHQVHAAFEEFLAQDAGPLSFGTIDLNLWATAVKRPVLAGAPAREREPYGVAELFRQCLEEATAFRQRRQKSGRRLLWTVVGAGTLVTALLALLFGLLLNRVHPLESRLPTHSQDASVRLAGDTLEQVQKRLRDLQGLQQEAQFSSLPAAEQDYVADLAKELSAYVTYWQEAKKAPAAEDVSSEQALDEQERILARAAAPAQYESAWRETRAVAEAQTKRDDLKALRAALEDETNEQTPFGWYWQLRQRGRELERAPATADPEAWNQWHGRVSALLEKAKTAGYRESARLPGAKTVTNASLLHFDKVIRAQTDWDHDIKPVLERVRDISAALGLGTSALEAKARPLDIPSPPAFAVDEARTRLDKLKAAYPDYKDRFVLTGLPAVSTPGLREAAKARYDHLIEAARPLVLRRLKDAGTGDRETLERWRELLPWLADPRTLADWRALALLLGRLSSPVAEDPVADLKNFLSRDYFDIELKDVTLIIPYERIGLGPAGRLQVIYQPAGKPDQRQTLTFEPFGEGVGDNKDKVTRYSASLREGKRLVYHPGDELRAELPSDAAGREQRFSWVLGRSALYQFEHLVREPFLHGRKEEFKPEDRAEGVFLKFEPENGVPVVPDLVPVVRFRDR